MNLTREEYCQFNLKSKINLLKDKGKLLFEKKVDRVHEIRLFVIYDFHVEAFCDRIEEKILRIDPVRGNPWYNYSLN